MSDVIALASLSHTLLHTLSHTLSQTLSSAQSHQFAPLPTTTILHSDSSPFAPLPTTTIPQSFSSTFTVTIYSDLRLQRAADPTPNPPNRFQRFYYTELKPVAKAFHSELILTHVSSLAYGEHEWTIVLFPSDAILSSPEIPPANDSLLRSIYPIHPTFVKGFACLDPDETGRELLTPVRADDGLSTKMRALTNHHPSSDSLVSAASDSDEDTSTGSREVIICRICREGVIQVRLDLGLINDSLF